MDPSTARNTKVFKFMLSLSRYRIVAFFFFFSEALDAFCISIHSNPFCHHYGSSLHVFIFLLKSCFTSISMPFLQDFSMHFAMSEVGFFTHLGCDCPLHGTVDFKSPPVDKFFQYNDLCRSTCEITDFPFWLDFPSLSVWEDQESEWSPFPSALSVGHVVPFRYPRRRGEKWYQSVE